MSVRLATIAVSILLLAGCSAPPAGPYTGTDLAGVPYGRSLDLQGTQGQP